MTDAAPYLSPSFPHRDEIRRAARLDTMIVQMRERGIPVPPNLVREAQHAHAVFQSLPQHEQGIVSRLFNADKQMHVEQQHQHVEELRETALNDKSNRLLGELTKDMAGAGSRGLSMAQVGALRAGVNPKLRRVKLPTGAEADERVRAATGLTLKQYEARLDDLLVQRNLHKYSDPAKYEAALMAAFPNQPQDDADQLVKNWQVERVGLEMRRRNEKHLADEVELKPLPGDDRRLALIEATIKHEAKNDRSPFAKDQTDRLVEIREEGLRDGKLDVRAAIADAFLQHGGTMDVEIGNEPSQGEEVIEEYDNG